MLGTFGMRPKGTMSARAAGIASALRDLGINAQIATVPWDNRSDAGRTETFLNVPVTNTRVVRPSLWPFAVRELVQIAREFRPDIIHLFKPKGFGDLAARYLKRKGVPVVVDMDDWEGYGGWNDIIPYTRAERALFDWQERTWPALANGVTVASRSLEQYACELGSSAARTLYLPNQLHPDRLATLSSVQKDFPASHQMPGGDGTRNILVYTRFTEYHPQFLVEILNELASKGDDSMLIIAGASPDGSAESALRRSAQLSGVANRIHILGWVNPDNLSLIARQCDVALVPFDDTRVNRSKCSVKLLELLATGIPVVVSNVGENREYVNRHGGGLLARPGDASSHAARILEASQRLVSPASFQVPWTGLWSGVIDGVIDLYSHAAKTSNSSR